MKGFFNSLGIIQWFSLAMILYAIVRILSKYWGIAPSVWLMVGITIAYACSSICWLAIMAKRNQLALMSCIWQVLAAIISISVGVVWFHESLTAIQWAGIASSLVGLFFLSKI